MGSPKKLAWHVQTYSKYILFVFCTPMVLVYNFELGVINSSDFFTQRNLGRRVMYSLVSLFFFSEGWQEVTMLIPINKIFGLQNLTNS